MIGNDKMIGPKAVPSYGSARSQGIAAFVVGTEPPAPASDGHGGL